MFYSCCVGTLGSGEVLRAKHLYNGNPHFTSVVAAESITLNSSLNQPNCFTQKVLNTNRRRRQDILFVISKVFIAKIRIAGGERKIFGLKA